MKKFSTDDFLSYLKEEVSKVCKNNELDETNDTQRTEGFDRWIVSFFNDTNAFLDEDFEDAHIGAKDDLGIDLLLEDDTNNINFIVQTEFTGTTSKSKKKNINESKVNKFFDLHKKLMNTKWVTKHGNENAKKKFYDYPDKINNNYTFKYFFISTGNASPRTRELEEDFNKHYSNKNLNIQCKLLDFSRFKQYCDEARSLESSIPNVEFKIPEDKFFVKKLPHKTLVASIKANEIENLYRAKHEALFSYNIREFLGDKGQINKDIRETAEEESDNFFYYNNGISAVCTKLEIKNNIIKAEKFQIINGAQTVGALRYVEKDPKLEFLIRVTETKSVQTDSGINEKIIKFNNSQNQITDADFRSNDKIQLFLEQKFKAATYKNVGKISYIRKRRQLTKSRNVQNIKMEELAKIRYAFLFEPCTVISKAKSLWRVDGDGKYYDTFGNKEIITDSEFERKYLIPIIFYNDIVKRCNIEKKENKDLMYLKRFRFHFLHFYGKLKDAWEDKYKKIIDLKKLLNDSEYLDKFTESAFERIKDKINDLYINEEQKDEYKNAPIRDMTINKNHLIPLEKKILASIPKIKF